MIAVLQTNRGIRTSPSSSAVGFEIQVTVSRGFETRDFTIGSAKSAKYRPRASDLTMGACGFGDQIKGLFPSAETRTRAWDGLTWHVSPSPSPTLLLIKREAACSAATRARVWGGRVANLARSTVKWCEGLLISGRHRPDHRLRAAFGGHEL